MHPINSSPPAGFALPLQRAVPLVQCYACISVCYSYDSYTVNIPSVRQARNSGAAGGISSQDMPSGGLGLLRAFGAAASIKSGAQAAAKAPPLGVPKAAAQAAVAKAKQAKKAKRAREDDDSWLDGSPEAEDTANQEPFDHKQVEVGQFLGFKANDEPGFYLGKVMRKPEKGADGAMVVQVQWWASDPSKQSITSPARRKFYVALDNKGQEFPLENIPCATCLTQAFDLTKQFLLPAEVVDVFEGQYTVWASANPKQGKQGKKGQ